MPGSLRDAVAARLRRIGPARATLQAAAVLGATIDLDLLAAVLGTAPMDVLEQLDVGVRQAFLAERDGALAFRHELVRLAIAAGASAARRAWLHRRAAEVLRSRPDAHPLELARHAREGGDRALAAEGLAHAADLALARLDLAGAERLLDEAIQLQDGGRAAAAAQPGPDVARRPGRRGHGRRGRRWPPTRPARHSSCAPGRPATGTTSTARSGSAGPPPRPPPTRRSAASSLIAVAFGHRGNGDLRQAEAVLEEAAERPRELGLPAWTGVLRVHQGRPAEALGHPRADARRRGAPRRPRATGSSTPCR